MRLNCVTYVLSVQSRHMVRSKDSNEQIKALRIP